MHHVVVVDASVLVKLYIEEEFSEQALSLVSDSLAVGRSIVGPAHLLSEVTNAIRKQEHQGNLTASEADRAVQRLMALPNFLGVSAGSLSGRPDIFSRTGVAPRLRQYVRSSG